VETPKLTAWLWMPLAASMWLGPPMGTRLCDIALMAARPGARAMILFTRRKRIPSLERIISSMRLRSIIKATYLSAVQVRHLSAE
jgi:hypothetical protein